MKFNLFFLLLILLPGLGFSQYKKGRKLYSDNYFEEAIPYLKKSLDGKDAKAATESLAHSLRLMKNYGEAEVYYKKLIELGNPSPVNYFYYGEVLMNNGKYTLAEEQFTKFVSLAPKDPRGQVMINTIKEIKEIRDAAPGFEVKKVQGINSDGTEFSPVWFNNKLVFSKESPVNANYVAIPSEGLWKSKGLNLFYATVKGTDSTHFSEAEKFDNLFNKGKLNGPVTFSSSGKSAVFNYVAKARSGVSYPVLYFTEFNGKKWQKPVPVFLEKNEFSDIHPALSPDGKTLYFASNRSGGKGGFDLYKSTRKGSEWGKPENLGETINTALNETFPSVSEEGILYFSSDGHPGLGGLDVFSTELLNNVWEVPQNLFAPLNSTGDDFGMTFLPGTESGYFSSNRKESTGMDDIFHFRMLDKKINMAGRLLTGEDQNNPAAGLKIILATEDGTVVQTTTTDENGNFKFVNLPADQNFIVQLDEDNPGLPEYSAVYMADKNGVIFKKTTTTGNGGFTFYNLPYTGSIMDGVIEDDTRITVTGSLLAGESPAKPLAEQTVYLTDEQGKVVATGMTDQYGNFKFEHLPPDANFLVSLNPEDTKLSPNTRIVVTDSKGKTVRTFYTDAYGGFKFEILKAEDNTLRLLEEENTSVRIDLKGKLLLDNKNQKPLSNSVVSLVNERGEVIRTGKTDAYGNFTFTNLPSDQIYLVQVSETDVPLNTRELFVANEKGRVVRKLLFGQGGYHFEVLKADHQSLASIYVEDPWLKMKEIKESKKDSITVIENIYYEYGKYEVLSEAAKVLDKVVTVMNENPDIFIELSSHTDSRSSAEFNLSLSQKRARAAVDYIISKGIPSRRIEGVGLGESKLVNYCSDGVECSEEQHQQNRRTEFKVVRIK